MDLFTEITEILLNTGALEAILLATGAPASAIVGIKIYKKFKNARNS